MSKIAPAVVVALALAMLSGTASAACEATQWNVYRGTTLLRFPGSTAYFYTTDHVAIDADGAPNAYHPLDKGLDAIGNAEFPNGNWRDILVVDPQQPTQPYTQPDGPFAGFFLAGTSLQDRTRPLTDPARYLDARTVPYIVFPGSFRAMQGTGDYGDIVAAQHLTDGKQSSAIVGDGGPTNDALGEMSIGLAERLGGSDVNPRNGSGAPRGTIVYVVFPRSRANPAWPVTQAQMDARASAAIAALGGWDRIIACVRP